MRLQSVFFIDILQPETSCFILIRGLRYIDSQA
jgi:hypothetical protein